MIKSRIEDNVAWNTHIEECNKEYPLTVGHVAIVGKVALCDAHINIPPLPIIVCSGLQKTPAGTIEWRHYVIDAQDAKWILKTSPQPEEVDIDEGFEDLGTVENLTKEQMKNLDDDLGGSPEFLEMSKEFGEE